MMDDVRMMAGRGSCEVGAVRMMDGVRMMVGRESCEDDGW